jgi:AraC-like DNA-binding protein
MASANLLPQLETTINGPRTRRWSLEARDCPEMLGHRIARLGIDEARAPYERVRLRPAGSFILASIEGEGRMLLEGRWQRVPAGALCLAPPRVLNALRAVPGKPWTFAWVRYDEPHFVKPLVGADSPLRLREGAAALAQAVSGLRAEWQSERDPALVHHWLCLVHGLARRLARPWRSSSRIAEVWETVGRDLAADWKLSTLARACSLSGEHLRRLCLRELGRTPMEHVTYMRMQRGQEILVSDDSKLECIAAQVGYKSAAVFSRAFTRCIGMTPTEFRERR